MKALELWKSVNTSESWESWLNEKGNDGTLLDTADNVTVINKETKKALKITYEPTGHHDFKHWNSGFDCDENKIDVLNVIFNDFEKAKSELPDLIYSFTL